VNRRFEQADHQAPIDILLARQAGSVDLLNLVEELTPRLDLLLERCERNILQRAGLVVIRALDLRVLLDQRLQRQRCG
jgi:hypothetical protein